jgi:CheY-like chemotaxis protein
MSAANETITGPARSILVVDDDADICIALSTLLELEGYLVTVAANRQQGLEILRGMSPVPCVILLDLMMPVMDGWEMLEALRADETLSRIAVVLLTAWDPRVVANIAVPFLKKPFDGLALIETIRNQCLG